MIVVDDLGYVKRDSAETGVLFEVLVNHIFIFDKYFYFFDKYTCQKEKEVLQCF